MEEIYRQEKIMPRQKRPVIAVSLANGERKNFDSVYACAKAIGANVSNVLSALDSRGTCKGWMISDTKENIQRRIDELKKLMEEL